MPTEATNSIVRSDLLEIEMDGAVAVVWINRPDKLNALSMDMLAAITDTFDRLSDEKAVHCVVLRGRGRAFCTGADTSERPGMTDEQVRRRRRIAPAAFSAARNCTKPVIAYVHGYALGSGLELAISCDIVVAADDTKMGLIETVRGSIPAGGGTQILPALIGQARAKELVFTGRRFTGTDAERWGIVSYALPEKEAEAKSMELAREIVTAAPIANSQAKRAIVMSNDIDTVTGFHVEAALYERTLTSADRREALAAFAEKRPAVFTGE